LDLCSLIVTHKIPEYIQDSTSPSHSP
jgi:NAD(P)-dependent dehydrogenase (short-subunit alcohol dehydrogenase family)